MNTINKDGVSLVFYHLDPRWCSHKEFDDILERGLVNTLRLTMDGYGTALYGCKKAKEYNLPVWLVPPIFLPAKQTIEEYMEKNIKFVDKLKAEDVWDAVVGFQWDEPLLRKGHTNDALLTMTKAMSETFGKRIFANFSLYEIAGKRGNDGDPDFQWLLRRDCSHYLTDVGFDLYGWDMRPEMQEKLKPALEERGKQEGVELRSGTELYQHYTDVMLKLVENKDDVRVWYYPCAYECRPNGGIALDEGYCLGHLKGYRDLLLKQKNPGGLCVYTYKSFLDTKLHKKNPEKWVAYEKACKDIVKEFSELSK